MLHAFRGFTNARDTGRPVERNCATTRRVALAILDFIFGSRVKWNGDNEGELAEAVIGKLENNYVVLHVGHRNYK